jgi:hypothetical protein
VSRAVEDICELCYRLAHRHKFLENNGINSSADDSLFVEKPEPERADINDNGLDDGGEDPTEYEQEKTGYEEEASKSTVGGEDLQEKPEVDVGRSWDPATESREQMIIRANEHVQMVRAQRILYVNLVLKAREHSKQNIEHIQRSYTFVVDFGQNMELPSFNGEQPGSTYYYSPLSVYNLGMVDQSHKDCDGIECDHMHAHVYHEGIGKKGANNVCSLIVKTLQY